VNILRKNKLLFFAMLVSLILSLSGVVFAQNPILNDLDGKPVDISSYQGKPVMLFFWTTWCHYCRTQIKILNKNHDQLKKDGIIVLAVNIGESDYKIKRFFKDYALNFKVLLDEQGDLADNYDVMGVPTYILLDKTGKVVLHDNTFPQDCKSLLVN